MDQTKPTTEIKAAGSERHGPPIPKFLFKLVNPLMKAVLRSPFHGEMSERLMVLSFIGRKTGKRYATPVGYVRSGSEVFVFTHSPWRNNFRNPAPVWMHIRGKEVTGAARIVNDPARIRQILLLLTAAHGEGMSRQMGFWVENLDSASLETIQQATQGTYFIEIQTTGESSQT